MTRIDFYHDAADKLETVARIAQKAFAQRLRLRIYAPDTGVADRIDRILWTFQSLAFVPHVRTDSPLAGETPILIDRRLDRPATGEVLVNLADHVPPEFASADRLIEVVGRDEDDKGPARARFRQYRELGYEIQRHDLSSH